MSENTNDAPAAVIGTSVACKTMADGTLRISFDFSPTVAQLAFSLYGAPGTAAAVAKMTLEASVGEMRKEASKTAEKGPHGKSWELWHKAGTFFSAELHEVLGITGEVEHMRDRHKSEAGPAIVTLVKGAIYDQYGVDSLTNLAPTQFRGDMRARGIEHILPKDF